MRVTQAPLIHTGSLRWGESVVYNLIRLIGAPFRFDVAGYENIQTPGPAIYIANHLGAMGPIAVILSVPLRFYPWVISEMMDFERAPRYLFDDFVKPTLHLGGWFGLSFSTLLTKISVRLINAIGSVSIDRFGGLTRDGFRHSIKLLRQGKNLLIFPEDPLQPLDPHTSMRPFMPGFAALCRIFQQEHDYLLPVYPVAVHSGSDTVSIGKPEFYMGKNVHREGINEFTSLIESRVKELYLDFNISREETIV